jgi:hypothetical protein
MNMPSLFLTGVNWPLAIYLFLNVAILLTLAIVYWLTGGDAEGAPLCKYRGADATRESNLIQMSRVEMGEKATIVVGHSSICTSPGRIADHGPFHCGNRPSPGFRFLAFHPPREMDSERGDSGDERNQSAPPRVS